MPPKRRAKILVIPGPNLNLLGTRETSIYGRTTIKQINQALLNEAGELGVELEIIQSNIDWRERDAQDIQNWLHNKACIR